MNNKFLLLIPLLVQGCASTPSGKSIDNTQLADSATTIVGLSQGLTEANPLGLALIPAKFMIGKHVDTLPCEERLVWERESSKLYAGIITSNMTIIIFGSNPIGLASGILAYQWKKKHHKPKEICNVQVASLPITPPSIFWIADYEN